MSRIVASLINTGIIVLIIPTLGLIINWLNSHILSWLCKIVGCKLASIIGNYLTFAGTIHHELSHALFAFCTGAKVRKIDLFKPNGYTLGKVVFSTRGNAILQSIQLTMSAVAPMILGCVSEYLLIKYVTTNHPSGVKGFIIYYLIISILLHMTMSRADIENALKGLPICVILIFLLFLVSGISIPELLVNIK